MSWCLMLHLPSKNLEGRRRDQGSRHRSISSQVWLVECPRAQLSSTVDYWRSFQPFPFTLLRTTLVFIRGGWSQESPGLRRSASSCWACYCWVHLRGFEIICHWHHWGHREGGKTDHRSVYDWSLQFQGAFGSFILSVQTVDCPAVNCQLCCAGRQVGEGGGWCWDQPRHIEVHYLLILYSPLSYFVIWHLISDQWLFCWLLAQMYDFKVWLLWLLLPD